MFPTDQPTAASSLPAPAAAGTPGFFTGGNPASGTPATVVDADWLNMIQQELLNLVEAAGETPSKTAYNQVLSACRALFAAAAGSTSQVFNVAPAVAPTNAMQLQQATGRLLNVQVFTSSGTYTPTAGTTSIIVEAIGAGGGGGGANAAGSGQISSGGNGGGGAYAKGRFTTGFAGAAVTIGAGGTSGGTGGTGGTTSLASLISVSGGVGGGAGSPFTPPGSSGNASAGGATIVGGNIIASVGFAAQAAIALSVGAIFNVLGAQSQYGPGPIGGFGNGTSATTKGTGGTGALAGPSTGPFNGGAGAPGILIVWEYA